MRPLKSQHCDSHFEAKDMIMQKHYQQEMEQMLWDIEVEYQYTENETGKSAPAIQVLNALRHVPRHEFVPEAEGHIAYIDHALPIGRGQTISQPFIVALMTELLNPKQDHSILEIGTGSGYQAAILAQLVKQVYSVEIISDLARHAELILKQLGYNNIQIKTDDGYEGWQEHAPYDGIIITAATPHIPYPLLEQLKPEGVMVVPIGREHSSQQLCVVTKEANGAIKMEKKLDVVFVPLTGEGVEKHITESQDVPEYH